MSVRESVSAVRRFGLGARPGELARVGNARDWLLGQLRTGEAIGAFAGLPSSLDYLRREYGDRAQKQQRKAAADAGAPAMQAGRLYREAGLQEIGRRYQVAVGTDAGFAERLVRFWSNHFAVSVDKRQAALYAAPMEREAIRPHLLGRFSGLLVAVETHPAMLRYLDNANSIGGDSRLATRARRRAAAGNAAPKRSRGLNENLAREILELHTLGVDGGYTQADVAELARAITGWSIPAPRDFEQGAPGSAFVFRAAAHEGGARSVLGKRYPDAGADQGRAILETLARHPATARHVCRKLAVHFVADDPPETLVRRMAAAWTDSGGDLPSVYRALVESPEAWSPSARKFKTPDDFVVSALRAVAADAPRPAALQQLLARMGQPPFTPRSPAGFADDAGEWSGPDALWKRVQAAQLLAEMAPQARIDPLAAAKDAFAGTLDAETLAALRRAESPREGLALLFASPAFQWRT
jgi:uncharacterized protein (DUF1800 family)